MFRLIPQLLFELQRLNGNLQELLKLEVNMTEATDNLAAAVQRETTVVSSVTTLISGLAAQIKQTSTDPQVQALADQINANSDTLANAVTANTPAAAGDSTGSQPNASA